VFWESKLKILSLAGWGCYRQGWVWNGVSVLAWCCVDWRGWRMSHGRRESKGPWYNIKWNEHKVFEIMFLSCVFRELAFSFIILWYLLQLNYKSKISFCDVPHCLGIRMGICFPHHLGMGMGMCNILDTTHFKAVMAMNLSELHSLACFCDSSTRMGDLLGSLIWGSQKRTILYHWDWVVTNGIRAT